MEHAIWSVSFNDVQGTLKICLYSPSQMPLHKIYVLKYYEVTGFSLDLEIFKWR